MAKKHRGHYCKICGEYKSNESFSGKGHAQHICKECMGKMKKRKLCREQKMVLKAIVQDEVTLYWQAYRLIPVNDVALLYPFHISPHSQHNRLPN